MIILLREIIFGEEDEGYNCSINIQNSIILYDIEKSEVKKIYITKEDSGECNTYLPDYKFKDTTFSKHQNIFIINNSIVYIKDHQRDYGEIIDYSLFIINILNGDIKYEFNNTIKYKCGTFDYFSYNCQKSLHLCDNIFLFNEYELTVKKNEIEQNKIDILYGTNGNNNNRYYYIKLKKNLILLYNSHEIKIFHYTK